MDAIAFLKKLIFFLPLPIAIAIAWHCRRRGRRFSRLLVYALPFLLPVVFYFIHIRMSIDLISPILGKEGTLWFITPYGCSAVTSGALTLLKSRSAFVRVGVGVLSPLELFCLHAGVFALGLSLGILIALVLAFETGYARI